MNENKHLLLWSSVGVLTLLVVAAVRENYLRGWRQIQASVRTDAGPLDERLRQVVVPKLHVTDRCVTCHVGMAPGEQGATGHPAAAAHPPVGHDPAEFGCTVCHGGQGRATDQDDAHGNVPFWPEPMIPAKYAYAGCGSCHTHIRVPGETELTRGRNLVERFDCLACHRIDGRGGTQRPGGAGGMEGPDLSRIGAAGFSPQWYADHVARSKQAQGGPWKGSVGLINSNELAVIEAFLSSRVGVPRLVEAKALFHAMGCRGCHKIGGVGGDDGPDLTHAGQKDPGRLDFTHVSASDGTPRVFDGRGASPTSTTTPFAKPRDVPPDSVAQWHAAHLRDPAKIVPGSQMPRLGLSEDQLDLLTLYLLSLRRSDVPEAYWPKDRVRAERLAEREFGTDGATLFGTFCAACHGRLGEGRRFPGATPFPAVGNVDFLAAASDDFLTQSIQRGRPGRRMPSWGEKEGGLRPEEIRDLVAHLRRSSGVAEPKPTHAERRWVQADAQAGQRLFTKTCAGCHGLRGEGLDAPALANPALLAAAGDDYFVETISRGRRGTDMNGFRKPSPVFPTLSASDIEAIVAYIRTWERQK
jgi:cbb3-type cytochrome c oxidase subunit III